MRSVAPMRVAKIGYIAVSAALCFFGVLLIVKPEISLAAFGLFTGIVLIIFGIIKIVGYLSRDLYRLAFQYDLACGILVIALGIMVILEPNDVIETILFRYLVTRSSHLTMPSIIAIETRHTTKNTVQHFQRSHALYINGPIHKNKLPMAVAPSHKPWQRPCKCFGATFDTNDKPRGEINNSATVRKK